MKLKSLVLAGCLSLFASAYADDHNHVYPQTNKGAEEPTKQKAAIYPGECAIEINNRSFEMVTVYGSYDDGKPFNFSIPAFDARHLIQLDYYDYRYGYSFCHPGVYLTIGDSSGHILYSSFTTVGTILEISPFLNHELKIEAKRK